MCNVAPETQGLCVARGIDQNLLRVYLVHGMYFFHHKGGTIHSALLGDLDGVFGSENNTPRFTPGTTACALAMRGSCRKHYSVRCPWASAKTNRFDALRHEI